MAFTFGKKPQPAATPPPGPAEAAPSMPQAVIPVYSNMTTEIINSLRGSYHLANPYIEQIIQAQGANPKLSFAQFVENTVKTGKSPQGLTLKSFNANQRLWNEWSAMQLPQAGAKGAAYIQQQIYDGLQKGFTARDFGAPPETPEQARREVQDATKLALKENGKTDAEIKAYFESKDWMDNWQKYTDEYVKNIKDASKDNYQAVLDAASQNRAVDWDKKKAEASAKRGRAYGPLALAAAIVGSVVLPGALATISSWAAKGGVAGVVTAQAEAKATGEAPSWKPVLQGTAAGAGMGLVQAGLEAITPKPAAGAEAGAAAGAAAGAGIAPAIGEAIGGGVVPTITDILTGGLTAGAVAGAREMFEARKETMETGFRDIYTEDIARLNRRLATLQEQRAEEARTTGEEVGARGFGGTPYEKALQARIGTRYARAAEDIEAEKRLAATREQIRKAQEPSWAEKMLSGLGEGGAQYYMKEFLEPA